MLHYQEVGITGIILNWWAYNLVGLLNGRAYNRDFTVFRKETPMKQVRVAVYFTAHAFQCTRDVKGTISAILSNTDKPKVTSSSMET